jgi:hypothetical protein
MTVPADWQEGNDRYLQAAMSWLRTRLERLAGTVQGSQQAGRTIAQTSIIGTLKNWPGTQALTAPPVPDDDVSSLLAGMERAGELTPPPALVGVARLFGLSAFERDILLLCAGMELDTRIPALCARAQDNPNRPYPTFALAFALFDEPRWDALSPDRPLRHWRMVEIAGTGATPLTSAPLKADERIVSYIKGLNILDTRLAPLLIAPGTFKMTGGLPPSQEDLVGRITGRLSYPDDSGRVPVIELLGPDPGTKQVVATHAAAALGRHLFRLPSELIPAQPDELEALARLWERESILLPLSLYLEHGEHETATPPLHRFLARTNGIIFLDVRDMTPLLSPLAAFEVTKPTPPEQEALWRAAIPSLGAEGARVLAGQFSMNVSAIHDAAEAVPADASREATMNLLWESCVASTRPRLDLLAQRLVPRATLPDLVLPERECRLISEIAAQVRHRMTVYDEWGFRQKMNRGLGISALFTGESGTGKTMAAEAIAHELSLDLYRIDLSQVVSKYIGETEKNLRRLFDAAEDGGAILFFDEADALFGKRSEVKDSHDRYANIEINYLLQRMESFQGLAILATNAKSALDTAFVRRLRFIIDFPYPGPAERRAIWVKVFPPGVPSEPLDIDRLSRFNLTGGSIHNIALNAAFLAARSAGKVTMPLVLDAMKIEYGKLNRPVNDAEFQYVVGR